MLNLVALLVTDVSEKRIATIIRVTRIIKLGMLAVTSYQSTLWLLVTADIITSLPILITLMMVVKRFSETSVLMSATRHNIPDDGILHSHCCENLKCYMIFDLFSDSINPNWPRGHWI
jgi:hypothetical protein